ncbi:MAG: hypothetical protein LC104_10505 [Bacteroidales bacterium]|nr:hypothetical protein [Bacteroidales bacterium]
MSELTPCPTCQATLRIPSGVAMIRCPNCKTILAVEPIVPTPVVAAPPLPFGRPQPAGGVPVARPVPHAAPVSPHSTVRAHLAPVTEDYLANRTDDTAEMVERRRKLKRELQKMEDRERRLQARYAELVEHCQSGRIAMTLTLWGMRAQALAVVLLVAGLLGAVLVSKVYGGMLAWACVGCGGVATLLILGGFGFAIAGPEKGRHIGIMGVIVTLILAGLVTTQFLSGLPLIAATQFEPKFWHETLPLWFAFSPGTELAMLAEHPARILLGHPFTIMGSIAAALEFTRLIMLALLTQIYSAEAKEPETGHQAIAAVSGLFWVVLLAAMFRISAGFGFDWAQPEETWAHIGLGVHAAITGGTLLGIGLAYLKLSQVMDDIVEIVDPRRLVDTDEKSAI